MAQRDPNIANGNGGAVRTGLVAAIQAAQSWNSGVAFPAYAVYGTMCLRPDVPGGGKGTLYVYDGVSWIALMQVDTAAHTALWQAALAAPIVRSYLAGLTLSAAGGSATFGIAAGVAAEVGNTDMIALAAAITKTTAAWAVGTANGSLDTGAIANNTWYHAWAIKRPDTGVVDALTSLSATAPTMPPSYTLKRRIGAMKTDGAGNWLGFTQIGDDFLWKAPQNDVSGLVLGTVQALHALSVPGGLQVEAHVTYSATCGANASISILSPDQAAFAVATQGIGSDLIIVAGTGNGAGGRFRIRTNASGQIASVCSVNSATASIMTHGWRDTRGRDL